MTHNPLEQTSALQQKMFVPFGHGPRRIGSTAHCESDTPQQCQRFLPTHACVSVGGSDDRISASVARRAIASRPSGQTERRHGVAADVRERQHESGRRHRRRWSRPSDTAVTRATSGPIRRGGRERVPRCRPRCALPRGTHVVRRSAAPRDLTRKSTTSGRPAAPALRV